MGEAEDWNLQVKEQKRLFAESQIPFWLVPSNDQTLSPSLKPLSHGTPNRGKNPTTGTKEMQGVAGGWGVLSYQKSATSNRESLIKKYMLGIYLFRVHSQLIAVLFLNYA